MSYGKQLVLALFMFQAGCAAVRTITYPSPCLDRGKRIRCQITGYEVWGTPGQVHAQAKKCPQLAQVRIDPNRDYGVVHCYAPDQEVRKARSVVVEIEEEDPIPDRPADMVLSLEEAEAPLPEKPPPPPPPAVAPPPEEVRDQPRVEQARKGKRKKKSAAVRLYND